MRRKFTMLFLITFLGLFFVNFLYAQGDVNFELSKFYGPDPMTDAATANKNLEDAVMPILDMFGFLSGGGLYNTADIHGVLGFDAGIKLTAMQVTEDQQPFFPWLPEDLQEGPLGQENVIPLPVLHVGVGLLGKLELLGRFFSFPMGQEPEQGNVTLIGLGAKYGLLQNFALPRVAVVAAYHYLSVPKEFDFGSINNLSAALVVSKGIPFITFYGGLGINYTTLELDFQLPPGVPKPDPMTFSKTNFRGNVGIRVTPFPFLFVNLDYNFGPVRGLSAGAGISIR